MQTKKMLFRTTWLGACLSSLGISAAAQNLPSGNPIDTLPLPTQLSPPQWETNTAPTLSITPRLQPVQPLEQKIQVNSVQIAGVHALPFASIAAFFEPLSGKQATIAQLAQAVTQATQAYQQAGFPLSFAYLPEQSFDNGVVRVTVVEGHINRVVLEGDSGKSEALLQAIVQPLEENKPLSQAAFERQTILLSRLEHLQVSASAAPPTTTDGGTTLILKLDRKPILFSVGADLRQGDPKAAATLTLNEPLWSGSQWQFSALLDNWNKERFASVTLNQALNAQGTRLSANFSDFKGKDNFAGDALQDTTTQQRLSVGITHPLHLSNTGSSIVGLSFFGINYKKNYDFFQNLLNLSAQEKVRALQAHWDWKKQSPSWQQSARIAFTQGLDALGADLNSSELLIENPAKLDFSRIDFDYSARWRAQSMWGVAAGIGGQASPDSLPTSERVSFGGTRYGRGYRSGEAAGDQGLGASIEANRQFVLTSKWLKSVEPYLLYEQARTWFHQANWQGQTLKSSSFGIRLSDNKHYALDLAVSKPQGDASPYNPEKKLRYSLSLVYQLGN